MIKKLLYLFFAFCLFSCEKNIKKPDVDKILFIEGLAVGSPYTKEIDEKGGFIDIDIAKAKIFFPENTLVKMTTASAQPITNTLSNYGLGIRLSSEYKNIKIEFKYPLNGLDPKTFEIYNAQGLNWVKSENKLIDTLNKTISIIQHSKNTHVIMPTSRVATHFYDYVVSK